MAQQQSQGESEGEKLLVEYQRLQEQMRAYALQMEQLQVQKAELEKAKEEVGGATGKVYITVGGVIVETTKDKALADIKEKGELTEVRINSVTKQFNESKAREKQLNEKLTQMYKLGGQGTGGVS